VTAAGDGAGNITFSNTDGADITITQDADPDDGGTDDEDLFADLNGGTAGAAGSETFQAGIVLAADVGESPTVTSSGDIADLFGGATSFTDNVLSNVNVLTRENASDALSTIDFALQQVNGLRAELGAVQSRFENTITNLSTTAENLSAARSRIQDADFAAETAALTRAQILQQAGISALAQANAAPQSVLSLLG
jgi:flagellin